MISYFVELNGNRMDPRPGSGEEWGSEISLLTLQPVRGVSGRASASEGWAAGREFVVS